MSRPRPTSIAELRAVTQPDAVRMRANAEHWTASLYLRRFSPYLTRELLRTPISANGVTVLMILCGCSAALSLLIPSIAGPLLALILGQLQMLIDCCDGEVARWRGTSSPSGVFLDKIGHYATEGLIPIALGIRAAGYPLEFPGDFAFTTLGLLFSLIVVLNKALNDMVHASRLSAGLPKLEDRRSAATVPTVGILAKARKAAKFVPFHRIYHSVEMTMLSFVVAIVGLFIGDALAFRWMLFIVVPLAALSLAGHFVAIISSRRLQ